MRLEHKTVSIVAIQMQEHDVMFIYLTFTLASYPRKQLKLIYSIVVQCNVFQLILRSHGIQQSQ